MAVPNKLTFICYNKPVKYKSENWYFFVKFNNKKLNQLIFDKGAKAIP
jgi:hypothetical protein